VHHAIATGDHWFSAWLAQACTPLQAISRKSGLSQERINELKYGQCPKPEELEALAALWRAPVEQLVASLDMPVGSSIPYPQRALATPTGPPSPSRITALSLRLLEDAYAETRLITIERTNAHRLALAWLVHSGVADEKDARSFWRYLATHNAAEHEMVQGCRIPPHGMRTLDRWHEKAGFDLPDPSGRARLLDTALERIDLSCLGDQIWRMCNRYQPGERQKLTKLFGARQLASINDGPDIVHQREPGLVVRMHEGERIIEQMTWGFPVVLRGKSGQPLKPKAVNNARFDKMGTYWRRWAERPGSRCLIPTTRFAEAEGEYGSMTTTWLSLKDEPVFAWAGLWSTSVEWGAVYTGVMTDAAPELIDIHDRCPVILEPKDWDVWLNAPLRDLNQFDRAPPAERFQIERTNIPWSKGGQASPKLL
jgi:putative SOS response-associated peptidase YedK